MDIGDILGVVVLYNTKICQSATLQTINNALNSVGRLDIIVYDHTSVADENSQNYENLNIIYKHDPRNISLGIAYNYTAEIAKTIKKNWILLLDQDTSFKSDLFEKYLSASNDFPNESMFVPILKLQNETIFSPCRYLFKRGFKLKNINIGLNSFNFKSPVNSGILVSTKEYLICGGYNEKIRLDFSDYQFIERFRLKHKMFIVVDSTGIQDFSNESNNVAQLNSRFSLYCQSARACNKKNIFDNLQYFITIFSRAISLSIRTKNSIFISTLTKDYLK